MALLGGKADAKLLAGGQSLIATLNMRLSSPALLVDINGIDGLDGIALADPAAELPACLLARSGEVDIAGPKGKRTVKADDFFKGLFETTLGPQDILVTVRAPAAGKDTRVGFAELARRHGDYAIVGL